MARRQILSLSEKESLLALPDDELTLTRMAYFSEHDMALISAHRKPASRFGFAVLLRVRLEKGNYPTLSVLS